MDSATSPSAPRRMTGMGDILLRVKVFVLEKPGIRESGAMRIVCWCRAHWLLMLCTLILMLFAVVAVTAFIVCWLMPPALIFDWFISWVLNRSGSIHAVYSGIFLWTGFFFHSHPTLMSFCTKGLTGVSESTVSKSLAKPSPSREKVPEGRMRGDKEVLQRYSLIISKTFSVLWSTSWFQNRKTRMPWFSRNSVRFRSYFSLSKCWLPSSSTDKCISWQ